MKIYVVMGTTGEYSDRDEWPVKAYVNKDKAKLHVENASRRANEIQNQRLGGLDESPNEYDPDMLIDYTGTSYFLYDMELEQ